MGGCCVPDSGDESDTILRICLKKLVGLSVDEAEDETLGDSDSQKNQVFILFRYGHLQRNKYETRTSSTEQIKLGTCHWDDERETFEFPFPSDLESNTHDLQILLTNDTLFVTDDFMATCIIHSQNEYKDKSKSKDKKKSKDKNKNKSKKGEYDKLNLDDEDEEEEDINRDNEDTGNSEEDEKEKEQEREQEKREREKKIKYRLPLEWNEEKQYTLEMQDRQGRSIPGLLYLSVLLDDNTTLTPIDGVEPSHDGAHEVYSAQSDHSDKDAIGTGVTKSVEADIEAEADDETEGALLK